MSLEDLLATLPSELLPNDKSEEKTEEPSNLGDMLSLEDKDCEADPEEDVEDYGTVQEQGIRKKREDKSGSLMDGGK